MQSRGPQHPRNPKGPPPVEAGRGSPWRRRVSGLIDRRRFHGSPGTFPARISSSAADVAGAARAAVRGHDSRHRCAHPARPIGARRRRAVTRVRGMSTQLVAGDIPELVLPGSGEERVGSIDPLVSEPVRCFNAVEPVRHLIEPRHSVSSTGNGSINGDEAHEDIHASAADVARGCSDSWSTRRGGADGNEHCCSRRPLRHGCTCRCGPRSGSNAGSPGRSAVPSCHSYGERFFVRVGQPRCAVAGQDPSDQAAHLRAEAGRGHAAAHGRCSFCC